MRHPSRFWSGVAVLAAGVTAAAAAPAVAASAAGVTGGKAHVPTSCTAARLPLPAGWRDLDVVAGDRSGRYQIGNDAHIPEPPAKAHVIVWRDGRIVGKATGDIGLNAVNSHGVAVGYRQDRPAVLVHGAMRYLPGGSDGTADAINDKGVVAGVRYVDIDRAVALRWPSTAKKPSVLAPPKGFTVEDIVGIDTDGTVVAKVWNMKEDSRSSVFKVYVWGPHRAGFAVPAPKVRGAKVDVEAIAIDQGRIGIVASVKTAKKTATWTYQYNLRTRTYQRISATVATNAINANGWVVGVVKRHAVLAAKARYVSLQAPRGVRSAVLSPTTLNDSGRIIGGSVEVAKPTSHGRITPVIWRCH